MSWCILYIHYPLNSFILLTSPFLDNLINCNSYGITWKSHLDNMIPFKTHTPFLGNPGAKLSQLKTCRNWLDSLLEMHSFHAFLYIHFMLFCGFVLCYSALPIFVSFCTYVSCSSVLPVFVHLFCISVLHISACSSLHFSTCSSTCSFSLVSCKTKSAIYSKVSARKIEWGKIGRKREAKNFFYLNWDEIGVADLPIGGQAVM